jgi:hypothetical protein
MTHPCLCPRLCVCQFRDRATLVAIRGTKQRLVNAYVVFDDESDAEPVLYVSVETRKEKRAAPPKEPTTEPKAKQPI